MSKFTYAADLTMAQLMFSIKDSFDSVAEAKYWNDQQFIPTEYDLYILYPNNDIVCLGKF